MKLLTQTFIMVISIFLSTSQHADAGLLTKKPSILKAIEKGDLEAVKTALEDSAALTIKNKKGEGIFHHSIRQNQPEISLFLLDKTSDLNITSVSAINVAIDRAENPDFSTKNEAYKKLALAIIASEKFQYQPEDDELSSPPLEIAVLYYSKDIFDALLKHIGNMRSIINHQSVAGFTALQIAAENGNLYAAQKLLEAGANIDLADEDGETPLMKATWYAEDTSKGKIVTNYLISKGAKTDLKNKDGYDHTVADPYPNKPSFAERIKLKFKNPFSK